MVFILTACNAEYIDTTKVQDIKYERLLVTFENGHKLYFGVDYRAGRSSPRLLVDYGNVFGTRFVDALKLRKAFFEDFRIKKYDRSWAQRCADWIHKVIDPNFHPRFDGWSVDKLFSEFDIELYAGRENEGSGLAKGCHLDLRYGTLHTSSRGHVYWGEVTSIESVVLSPTPIFASDKEAPIEI